MDYKIETKTYQIKVAEDQAPTLCQPKIVFNILKEDFSPVSESMYLLSLNVKNQLIDKILIAKGTYNALMIKPIDIFRPLLATAGNHFIIAHNHPSGDAMYSEDDIVFTNKLKKASEVMGISFLDHIIFTDKEFVSLRQKGIIS